jgi:hypothetical protein
MSIGLPFALLSVLAAAGVGIRPGIYSVGICPQPCSPVEAGKADVRGALVLLDADIQSAQVPSGAWSYLEDQSMFILDEGKANACFVLDTFDEKARTLAGVTRVGLTRWEVSAGIITVQVYGSPDASSIAFGILSDDLLLAGPQEAARLRASTPYHRDFLSGQRIGDADIGVCIRAAEAELQKEAREAVGAVEQRDADDGRRR